MNAPVSIAETGIKASKHSFRRNLERIREGQGLPIEALQSLPSLDGAGSSGGETVLAEGGKGQVAERDMKAIAAEMDWGNRGVESGFSSTVNAAGHASAI